MGGVLVSKDEELMRRIMNQIREWLGGVIGPMESLACDQRYAHAGSQDEKTSGRQRRAVAEYLEGHPKVKRVYYPGLKSHPQFELIQKQQSGSSGLMSLELNAPADDSLRICRCSEAVQKRVFMGGF